MKVVLGDKRRLCNGGAAGLSEEERAIWGEDARLIYKPEEVREESSV